MISAKTTLALPTLFKDICIIYPPTVKDWATLEKEFLTLIGILTETKEDIEDAVSEAEKKGAKIGKIPTPYENLFLKAGSSKENRRRVEKAFFLLIKEPVLFLPDIREIIVGEIEEGRKLKEEDFFDFQNEIRKACGMAEVEKPIEGEHPKIAEMKRKARFRDRVKAKQKAKGGGTSLEVILVSLFYRNIGVTPFNVGELPYALVNTLNSMGQNKEKYENDVRSVIAGAKKVKPKYWVYDPESD